jgi:hypothetical protein
VILKEKSNIFLNVIQPLNGCFGIFFGIFLMHLISGGGVGFLGKTFEGYKTFAS